MKTIKSGEDIFKILLPAGRIPEGSIVSRPSGTYKYTLLKKITVWPTEKDRKKKGAKPLVIEGTFIESGNGNYNQFSEDKELVWHISVYDLANLMNDELDLY